MTKETMERLLEILDTCLASLSNAQDEMNDAFAELDDDEIDTLSTLDELDCCNFAECREQISTAINELGFAVETLEYAADHLEDKINEDEDEE